MAGVMGDINNNLMGLQQLAIGRQQIEQAKTKEDDRKIASDSLRRFYESQQSGSPDYSLMNEAVLRSPELAQNVLSHIGIQEKRQGQDAAAFISRSFNAIDDPQRFIPMAQARAEYLASSGRDPKDTIALIEMVQSGNSAGAKKELQAVAAALTNQGYLDKDIYSDLTGTGGSSAGQEFAQLTKGLSVEEAEKARRIKLGLDPRAVGSADITTALYGYTDPVALSRGRIAGAVEGSKTTAGIDARVAGGGAAEQIEAERAGAGKGVAARQQDFIDRGVSAAEGVPTVKRALTLLDSISTGGIDKALINARQAFGVEGADEGELSYNLGKSVLSQLKETFGAAFTAAEGERLQKLEAGLGRNAESNKRILSQALTLMTSKAKRGKAAALDIGDKFTAGSIDEYLNLSLDPNAKATTKTGNLSDEELLSKY